MPQLSINTTVRGVKVRYVLEIPHEVDEPAKRRLNKKAGVRIAQQIDRGLYAGNITAGRMAGVQVTGTWGVDVDKLSFKEK